MCHFKSLHWLTEVGKGPNRRDTKRVALLANNSLGRPLSTSRSEQPEGVCRIAGFRKYFSSKDLMFSMQFDQVMKKVAITGLRTLIKSFFCFCYLYRTKQYIRSSRADLFPVCSCI